MAGITLKIFKPQVACVLLLMMAVSGRAENLVQTTSFTVSANGMATSIPVITISGKAPGPTLAMTAGIHGAEYAPIVAVQELLPILKAADLRGTVMIVPVANPASFFKRTVYYGPADWKNLNRSFPGSETGSYSERLAHALTTNIIEKCDYFLDIHAGDANESLISYAAYDADTEDPVQRQKSAGMAKALNFPRIIRGTKRPRDPKALLYTTNTARDRGKPNAAIESGELGRADAVYVKPIVEGVQNVMRYLQMLPGAVVEQRNQTYIDSTASLTSSFDGIFSPLKKAGDKVRKGDALGIISSLLGEKLATIESPIDGLIVYILGTPPVSKTESIATIGAIANY